MQSLSRHQLPRLAESRLRFHARAKLSACVPRLQKESVFVEKQHCEQHCAVPRPGGGQDHPSPPSQPPPPLPLSPNWNESEPEAPTAQAPSFKLLSERLLARHKLIPKTFGTTKPSDAVDSAPKRTRSLWRIARDSASLSPIKPGRGLETLTV